MIPFLFVYTFYYICIYKTTIQMAIPTRKGRKIKSDIPRSCQINVRLTKTELDMIKAVKDHLNTDMNTKFSDSDIIMHGIWKLKSFYNLPDIEPEKSPIN